ncbi:collagen alpha-1(I) chain-like [Mesoplodon densirostris]|uniref:collagen alpha-1(I) chain-like n=1 Tax=Mesoplodon densirostris TaxID=48708 RepID=UPI0028DD36F5|nr:collagen alpha-1(I) chain-like [Mesoplodon densirostris]
MGRRRHGGRAIGPRLSRVTKAAGARPPAGAGGRLTGINQVGERARAHTGPGVPGRGAAGRGGAAVRRQTHHHPPERAWRRGAEHRGPTDSPHHPRRGRTDDRPTLGRTHEGAAARRRAVEARRLGAVRGRPRHLLLLLLLPPHTTPARPATSAARERGPRATGSRTGGRPARARSLPLARPDGAGGAGGGARAERPDTPTHSPPDGRERGGADTAAGPRRLPGDPTTHARASAPGRGGARRGGDGGADGRPSAPTLAQHATDAGGRAATAEDHGAEPRRAREAKHPGTRPGGVGRRDGRGRRTDVGERADEARLARPAVAETRRPPHRRRGGAAGGGRPRADARGPGGHPKGTDASRPPGRDTGSHRQRPPAQGRSRDTPRTPTGLLLGPHTTGSSSPLRGARDHPPPPNLHEPRPARDNTLPHAHRPPRGPHHTHTSAAPDSRTPPQEPHPGASHDPAPPPGARVCDVPPAWHGGTRPPKLHLNRPRRIRLHPSPTPGGSCPKGNAPERGDPHRAHPPPAPRRDERSVRAGATGSSWLRDWGAGTPGRPLPAPLGSTTGVAARTRPRATRRPGGTLPRLRGGRRGPRRPRGHCTLGRGSGWGVRYPKAPSRIAREGFLTEGASSPTHRLSRFGPAEALHEPPPPSPRLGGEAPGANTIAPTPVCHALATLSPLAAHAESHSRDTPPRRGPEEHAGKRERHHRLGLGHLRDDPERSRGTTEDQARRARHHHIDQSVNPESHGPQGPEGGGGARRGPSPEEPASASPAHHRPTFFSGTTPVADDPAGRTPDTWHRACGGGGRRSHHRVPCGGAKWRRTGWKTHAPHLAPRRPRVSQRPEAAPRVGSAGRTHRHTREPARRPRRAAQGARGRFGLQTAARGPQSPDPCVRPEPQSPQRLDAREHRVSTYLVAKKAHFGRKISQRPGAGPIHESRGGPRNLGPATCPQLVPIHTSPGALGGYLVDPRSVATKWGRGNVGGGGERQRAGRGRPPRFARPPARAGTGPPRSLRAKTRFKKKKMSHTRPPPTSGPHEGPHEGPCLSLRVTPRGPGQRSKGSGRVAVSAGPRGRVLVDQRQQEAPTPGRHRDSRHQRRPAHGTLPRARRPSHNPHEGRRGSRDKGQYKSGRQVAPDNRLQRPRAVSLSPAGHRGRGSAGPPKRPG